MLGSRIVVSTLATPHSRSISRLKSCSAYCATRLPDGCGAKIAVLPAARILIAFAAMVGTECVTGSDHADHAPRRVLDDAQPGLVAARLAAHGLHAQHIAACSSASESCGRAGPPWSLPAPSCPTLRSDRCRSGARSEIMRPRSSRLISSTFFCAACAALTASSTVRKTPSCAARCCWRMLARWLRAGRRAGRLRLLHLGAKPRHNLPRNLRNHLFLVRHLSPSPSFTASPIFCRPPRPYPRCQQSPHPPAHLSSPASGGPSFPA